MAPKGKGKKDAKAETASKPLVIDAAEPVRLDLFGDTLESIRAFDPESTLFRPGSVSKLVTWTAVMQLVEQGKLSLDDYAQALTRAGLGLSLMPLAALRRTVVVSDTASQLFAGTLQEAVDPWGSHTRAQAEAVLHAGLDPPAHAVGTSSSCCSGVAAATASSLGAALIGLKVPGAESLLPAAFIIVAVAISTLGEYIPPDAILIFVGLLAVVGARPNFVKSAPVIAA